MVMTHLALEDGLVFAGQALTFHPEAVTGEVVFSTASCGYTEILTDPSYYGQIVVLANPEIGNYGVNTDDFQSDSIKVRGLVVRQLSSCASSHRSELTLRDWLMREQIPVVFGVDTRAIITHIREKGSMMAAISTQQSLSVHDLVSYAQQAEPLNTMRLSSCVTGTKPYSMSAPGAKSPQIHVVVLDFGVKRSILRNLLALNARLTIMPGDTAPEDIWAKNPDGIFLSNGPGDPKTEIKAVNTVRSMLGKLPIFGVCLGHQILAQALSHETYKLKFGHRGSNQAVRTEDGALITTAQNHGYAVSLPADDTKVYATNISDGTNEGLMAHHLWAFSVQFHPEGAPGPLDARFYFDQFIDMINAFRQKDTTPLPAPIS